MADAKGFVDWAKRQGKGDFGAVDVITLLDQQATRSAILSQFDKLRASKPEGVSCEPISTRSGFCRSSTALPSARNSGLDKTSK